jgi:riboflavin kinase/FMN adenylyltransferase
MQVYRSLEAAPTASRGIALGDFDGVHLGHRALIGALIRACRASSLRPAIFTFSYGAGYDFDDTAVTRPFLMTEKDRLRAIASLGVEDVWILPVEPSLSHCSPTCFLKDIVSDALGGRLLAMGEDARFGHAGAGDAALLRREGPELSIRPLIVPDVTVDGRKVSSTRIREALGRGDVAEAATLMTRPFQLHGTARAGDAHTFVMAYPATAVRLPKGRYRTRVSLGDRTVEATSAIGDAGAIATRLMHGVEALDGAAASIAWIRREA